MADYQIVAVSSSLKMDQQRERSPTLRQRYVGASEVDIKGTEEKTDALRHIPVSISLGQEVRPRPPIKRKKILDGFHLLEASEAHLPTDARQAVLVDQNLYGVLEEDMGFFTHLVSLDVCENFLDLTMFRGLPKLKELRIACNNMHEVELGSSQGAFNELLSLDISYNSLSLRSVQNLDALTNLRELDLSGNALGGLPHDMYRFHALEKLYLDNNKIDDNNVFSILCAMENLRYLSLAYNFLSRIPEGTMDEGMHTLLQVLDVSFNYFGTEEALQPMIELPRLVQAMVYGNPVLGPKGEDPQYIYIEDLVDTSNGYREGHRFPMIDFIAEIPRKRNFKKGQPAGRHATYRDFSVVSVGGDYEAEAEHKSGERTKAKLGTEWREEGNKTLFAEAIALAQSQKVMSQIPDSTFITESAMTEDDQKVLKIADTVMDQVAEELNLQTSAEILYFQDKTNIPVSNFETEAQRQQHQPEGGMDGGVGDGRFVHSGSGMAPSKQVVQEKVPSSLFSGPGRTMADPSTLQTHPIAVKTAMRALQFAINNPLTNYNEVPDKGGLPPHDYVRPTQAAINRQMPRREPTMKAPPEIKRVKNKTKRGLGEPSLIAQERKKERDRTLLQIEAVLDDLNTNVDEMVLKGPGAAGGTSKDNMDVMKTFARPKTGLKGLVQMVEEVVADLDA